MQPEEILPKPPQVWFFIVDAGRGRLLKCTRVAHGRLHVAEVSAIENDNEEHEHGRPSPRTGKSGNTYASGGHEDEHQIRRFAKEVVGWIEEHVAKIDCRTVRLFAAPRFLGELRKLYSSGLNGRLDEHLADLTHLTPAGLAKHPAVAELFPT